MERQYVTSSNILSIGYDPDNMILEVEFTTGAVYQYYDVSQSIYDGLMVADSHGNFLSAYVKKGGYRYAQV
jgi:hypothetical protein